MKHHLKHMAIAAGAVLVVLLVLKVDLRTAFQYAVLLACPLGRVGMMVAMNRHGSHGRGDAQGQPGEQGHEQCHDHAADDQEHTSSEAAGRP